MAHKTLIDGTAYEIKGGKTLVDGTAYSIKSGKTLVDGTAYEVGFSSSVIVNVIYPSSCNGQVTIDGTVCKNSGTYEALESISVYVQGYFGMINGSTRVAVAYLYLNNVRIASTPTSPPPTINYALSLEGCTEVTIEYKNENATYSNVSNCYITTK